MDQQKIGVFLKELRKQKEITQEQLADKFNVSSRTVSRWENGNNLPDLDILMEISDFYEVELREILNGERKNESPVEETSTILQAVEYTNDGNTKINKRILLLNIIAVALIVICILLRETEFYSSNSIVGIISSVMEGFSVGILTAGILMSSRYGAKIRAFKKRILNKNKKNTVS